MASGNSWPSSPPSSVLPHPQPPKLPTAPLCTPPPHCAATTLLGETTAHDRHHQSHTRPLSVFQRPIVVYELRISRTSRQRHKSAPPLRFKNSTRTSSIFFDSTRKTQKRGTELGHLKGDPLETLKNFRKKSKEDPLISSRFCMLC